jgi:hypothetical protein
LLVHCMTMRHLQITRRQFTKRTALTVAVAGFAGLAPKCGGSEQVSIYVRTISTFLNQIAGLLPDKAAFIARIVKLASDFDAAYQRGDLTSADSFFNSLEQNLTTLTGDIGVGTSNTVKTWLAIIGATVTSIAVLFKEQVGIHPVITAKAKSAKSAGAVERLAAQAKVDALYQAAKP